MIRSTKTLRDMSQDIQTSSRLKSPGLGGGIVGGFHFTASVLTCTEQGGVGDHNTKECSVMEGNCHSSVQKKRRELGLST